MNKSTATLLAALLLLGSASSDAATFQATLDSIKVNAQPGQQITHIFQLTLDAAEPRTRFHAKAEDWWPSEDGSQSFFRPTGEGKLTRSCATWVSLNPALADAEPGKTLQIRVTVSVPATAQPGGYWAVLTVDQLADPLQVSEGVGMQFLASVSVGIFVNIEPVHRAAKITELQILADEVRLKVRNEGDTPIAVEGRLEFIQPGMEEPLATIPISRRTLVTEPVATGLFILKLPSTAKLPSGRYRVRAVLDIGLDHYLGIQKELDVLRESSSSTKAFP